MNNSFKSSLLVAALSAFTALSSCGKDDGTPNENTGNVTPPTETETHNVKVWSTTPNRSKDLTLTGVDFSTKDNMSPTTVTLNPSTTYQTIDGFGAAITGATAYNLLKMDAADRTKFLKETFSPSEGYGMSYIRICIGCSDFSMSDYTCCDTKGIENFALTDEETKYVIPVLKEILAINPNIKILGSPWTAPRWMKVNNLTERKPLNSWTSGQLNPDYYADYGTYFVKWINAFKDNGIEIYAITPQNEPLNRGNSASMFMGWEEQRDFIKNGLGPALQNAGLNTKIYAFDHNYNYDNMADQKGYPTKIYGDPEASKYIAGAAYHNYGGSNEELNTVHNANPEKELVFTESTAGDWNDGSNLNHRLLDDMEQIALGTVNRWCKGSIIWNLMLDANRGPNRPGGCTTGFGAVDIDKDYKTIRRNSFYYIMAHMSTAAKPGAVRIGTSGFTKAGLTYTAFKNPDGTFGFVACNNTSETINLNINDGTHSFFNPIPAKSIVSMAW